MQRVQSIAGRAYARNWKGAFDPRVWLLALGTLAIGTDAYVVAGILPELVHDLSISLGAAGHVVTAYSLTYALSSPVLTAIAGRIKRRRLAVASIALFAVANVVCAWAPDYAVLLGARIAAGAAAGLFVPTAYTLATALSDPEAKSKALAAVALGLTTATAIGVPTGAYIGQWVGWRGTFCLVVFLAAVAALAIGLTFRRIDDWSHVQPAGLLARFKPLTSGSVSLALLPALFCCIAYFVLYTYLAEMLGLHGIKPVAVIWVFFFSGVGGVIGSLAGGQLSARFQPTLILAATFLLFALDAAAFELLDDQVWKAAALVFTLSLGGWMFLAPQQARLLSLTQPDQAQLTLALNGSCLYLGVGAGSAIGAWLIDKGLDVRQLNRVTVGFGVIALVALGVSVLRSRR
jgi:predicted MFS family arabinose efflux permease